MRKYFPEDVHGKKDIEFLELKQGSISVVEYAVKFAELAKFYSHYSEADPEFSKCIKFDNGLRPEIKKVVGYQKICVFADLIDSCRIYEEDNNAHYKIISEKRGKNQQNRGKPYDTCDTVGELTWFILCFIANVAVSKSRHRLFFYPKGKVKKHRKDL